MHPMLVNDWQKYRTVARLALEHRRHWIGPKSIPLLDKLTASRVRQGLLFVQLSSPSTIAKIPHPHLYCCWRSDEKEHLLPLWILPPS